MFNFEEYSFFNPSPIFREMTILQLISQNSKLSQESLARSVGVVPSMINKYLKDFEDKNFIKKTGQNRRNMYYELTDDGKKRLQYLVVSFTEEVSRIYGDTKKSFDSVLKVLVKNDVKNIMLYGAGVVGKIILKVLLEEGYKVIGFIDDSLSKQGEKLYGYNVYSPDSIDKLKYDATIVASFRHFEDIVQSARKNNIKNIFTFKIDDNGSVNLHKEE